MVGGVKELDARYCNQVCRGQDFFKRFHAALERAATENPNPLPAARPSPAASEVGGPNIDSEPLAQGAGEIAVIGLGLIVIAAVVALIWFIYQKVEYPFFSQTVWFVIPIGAFLCGMAAGSGFLLGHRLLNRLPTARTFAAAGMGGIVGYLLIFGLSWWFLEIGGVRVHSMVGFPDFLKVMVENQSVKFQHGGPIELGKWGYLSFAIDLVGFAFGVISMVAIAGGKAYCARCRRYLTTVGKQTRTSSDPEAIAAALHPVIAGVQAGRIQEALDLHAGLDSTDRKGFLTTTLTVEACAGCGMHLATLKASCKTDQGVQDVAGFVYQGRTDQRVLLPG